MQVTMPPPEANAAALSMILRTLEQMQVAIAPAEQEVAELKETQQSILSGQPDLLTKVRALQNRNKKFYTRLQDIPPKLVAQTFAWIPGPTVLQYQRLSKAIGQCLMTTQFAILNLRTAYFDHCCCGTGWAVWFLRKNIPKSIIYLTAAENIICSRKLIGEIPDGIGALQTLTHLDLSHNSLTGTLPSSFKLLVALQMLNLSNNQLSGESDSNCIWQRRKLTYFSTIPANISKFKNLESLKISGNSFACKVPRGIWKLANLRDLQMSGCKMIGSLAGVGTLCMLDTLDLSHNRFSGNLPCRELHGLRRLRHLHLSRNQFTGIELLDMSGKGSQEVADIKDAQLSVISSQRHLSDQVLGLQKQVRSLQNHNTKFFARLQDVPPEVIGQFFALIPGPTVLKYRRLSKTIYA
ncbi:hypothetical protein BJ741DRAFT_671938 [Chytriomyces cf. hyalinus JEL632]|nr:hypothetical protein BJ741DRAFT_671938 [Chytriomyces cf. hyalinus JEL632]